MLAKLIKHDFRALSKVLVPTHLAILAATIIATIGIAVNTRNSWSGVLENSYTLHVLETIMMFICVLMLIAIFASLILVAFIIFQRFYKSFMCDEGYLSFTLPVTTSQLLWSKLISAAAWIVINMLVVALCAVIFVLFGTSSTQFANTEFFRDFFGFISQANAMLGSKLVLPTIEFIVMMIVSVAYNILEVYLCLIIGGVLSQKHKILAAIGAYFGINMGVGIICSLAQIPMVTRLTNNYTYAPETPMDGVEAFDFVFGAINPYFLLSIGISIVLCIAFFWASHYLLKNKLNLE